MGRRKLNGVRTESYQCSRAKGQRGRGIGRVSHQMHRARVCAVAQQNATAPGKTEATTNQAKKRVITVEEQREIAKELITTFKEMAETKVSAEPMLVWTKGNEISNGRWVMFGLLVGLLTEYATGIDFIDQIRILISNLGIADVYE